VAWHAGPERGGITADFNTMRIHFTNGFSTTEPMVVARALARKRPGRRALFPASRLSRT
jgi:hypothetical protein